MVVGKGPVWFFDPVGEVGLPGRKEMWMRIALAVSFALVAAAPFFGRWRANVWLRKNMPAERTVDTVPKAA